MSTFTDLTAEAALGDASATGGLVDCVAHELRIIDAGPPMLTMSAYGVTLTFRSANEQEADPTAALTFYPDGRIHRHGKLIGSDSEIVDGLRDFVSAFARGAR